jgi:four helix bundle protein
VAGLWCAGKFDRPGYSAALNAPPLCVDERKGGDVLEKSGLRRQRVYTLAVSLAAYVIKATREVSAEARPVRLQLIRASTSIGLNIAEGWGESSPAEKARFYRIARRSATETVGALDIMVALSAIGRDVVERTDPALEEILAILTKMARTQESAAAAPDRRPNPRRPATNTRVVSKDVRTGKPPDEKNEA